MLVSLLLNEVNVIIHYSNVNRAKLSSQCVDKAFFCFFSSSSSSFFLTLHHTHSKTHKYTRTEWKRTMTRAFSFFFSLPGSQITIQQTLRVLSSVRSACLLFLSRFFFYASYLFLRLQLMLVIIFIEYLIFYTSHISIYSKYIVFALLYFKLKNNMSFKVCRML